MKMATKKGVLLLLSYLCLSSSAFTFAQAKGWRDIAPLHSTRADVEHLLGSPAAPSNEYTSVYHLEREVVIFDYQGGGSCEESSGWRVPRGTVTRILVTPKTQMRFSDLQINEDRYKKTSGGHRPQDVIYIDKDRGESITVYQDYITSITYFPAAGDDHLRCTGPHNTPGKGRDGTAYYKLDTYHEVSLETEKAALDNFAISLSEAPEKKGYIIAYAGQRSRAALARQRAARARKYLINERGIKSERIVTMYGGRREKLTVELYIASSEARPPLPTPAVR